MPLPRVFEVATEGVAEWPRDGEHGLEAAAPLESERGDERQPEEPVDTRLEVELAKRLFPGLRQLDDESAAVLERARSRDEAERLDPANHDADDGLGDAQEPPQSRLKDATVARPDGAQHVEARRCESHGLREVTVEVQEPEVSLFDAEGCRVHGRCTSTPRATNRRNGAPRTIPRETGGAVAKRTIWVA